MQHPSLQDLRRFVPRRKDVLAPLIFVSLVLQFLTPTASAQELVTQTGLHYFAVHNLDTGQVIQRGTAGSAGVAFANLPLAFASQYRVWILQAATL